jgi:hypothetical protein
VILVASYDLHQPGRDYEDVADLLKTASGGYCHFQGSVWLLDTLKDPAWWRDQLKHRGDANDEYFVSRLQRNWANFNDAVAVRWLKHPSRRW